MRIRAAGIIIKDGKILLMHRIKNRREYFVFPGGGVEAGESAEMASKREIKEELNLAVKSAESFFELENDFQGGKQKEHYFLVRDFSGTPELGGEEKERMNEDNQYEPVWYDLMKIKNLNNLYPELVKDKIIKLYGN